jgi:hypothetical protein
MSRGGPEPFRQYAIRVPSAEVTVSMPSYFAEERFALAGAGALPAML